MSKNGFFKRMVALIFVCVIVSLSIIPSFAEDTYPEVSYSHYKYIGVNQGALPYGYYSWAGLLGYYYSNSGNRYYYFELQNTSLAGSVYTPQAGFNNWSVPYQISEGGNVVNPVYRFYVPNLNGYGWNFQIRTDLGNVVFDSNNLVLYPDPSDTTRGYYQFTWDRSILGTSYWYIYSDYLAPVPSMNTQEVSVSFVYTTFNGSYIGSEQVLFYPYTGIIDVSVPGISGYIVEDVIGQGLYNSTNNTFRFNSLTTNQVLNVSVISYEDYIDSLQPCEVVFRYYTIDSSGQKVYLDNDIGFYAPSRMRLNYNVPFPEGYVSAYLWNPSGLDLSAGYPVFKTAVPSVAGHRYVSEYRVISLSDFYDLVTDSFMMSQDFADIINQNRQEASQEGYDHGYEIGYNIGYGAGAASGVSNPLTMFLGPVVEFMNIQLYPGITLGIPFLCVVAVCLIVIFLKMFAGG